MNFDTNIIVWVGLIIAFTVIEAATMGLTSIWFAAGALAGLIAAAMGFGLPIQIIVFLVVAVVLLVYTRPIVKRLLKVGHNKTNVDALIGESGFVLQEMTASQNGLVKVKGQTWTAKSMDNETISVDSQVEIIAIEGVKLIVKKK